MCKCKWMYAIVLRSLTWQKCVDSASKHSITYMLDKDTVVGRRFFCPKFRTKSRNFPALESLMKQKICPRKVLGNFKTKLRPKCFDETGPRSWLITEPRHDKTWRGLFPTNSYKNWAVQSHEIAKCMKFR